jgi:hypothetical protein
VHLTSIKRVLRGFLDVFGRIEIWPSYRKISDMDTLFLKFFYFAQHFPDF